MFICTFGNTECPMPAILCDMRNQALRPRASFGPIYHGMIPLAFPFCVSHLCSSSLVPSGSSVPLTANFKKRSWCHCTTLFPLSLRRSCLGSVSWILVRWAEYGEIVLLSSAGSVSIFAQLVNKAIRVVWVSAGSGLVQLTDSP